MSHELFTRMLFVDAIVGTGEHLVYTAAYAARDDRGTATNPLVTTTFDRDGPLYSWNRTALEALSIDTLQELYIGLKLHEVTHAC